MRPIHRIRPIHHSHHSRRRTLHSLGTLRARSRHSLALHSPYNRNHAHHTRVRSLGQPAARRGDMRFLCRRHRMSTS